MVIRQNGPELVKISEDIENVERMVKTKYEEMFSDLKDCLGTPDEVNKIWYGPRAAGCLREAEKGRPIYQEMSRALIELANKVNGDANAWGAQQNSKY